MEQGPEIDAATTVYLLRALRGWNQQEFAQRARLDPSAISHYEAGDYTPSVETFDRLVATAQIPLAFVEQVALAVRALVAQGCGGLGSRTPSAADAETLAREAAQRVSLAAAPALAEIAALLSESRNVVRAPAAVDREAAESLWRLLEGASPRDRTILVEHAPLFRSWAVCERLCLESERHAADDPERALELATLAVSAAGGVVGPETWRRCVRGFAEQFLGNAQRAGNRFRAAEASFTRGQTLFADGAGDPDGLLDAARLLDLEASLLRDQRRFPEALERLDRALVIAARRATPRGRLLLKKAFTLEQMGDAEGALAVLREALSFAEDEGDAQVRFGVRSTLAVSLLHLGRTDEAAELLPEVRARAAELGPLNRLRVRWLEGRLFAAQGQLSKALDRLSEVQRQLAGYKLPCDAAIVALEMAILRLEAGRTREVRALAEEVVPVFEVEGIERERLGAVRLFVEAARKEAATIAMAFDALEELRKGRG